MHAACWLLAHMFWISYCRFRGEKKPAGRVPCGLVVQVFRVKCCMRVQVLLVHDFAMRCPACLLSSLLVIKPRHQSLSVF